MGISRVTTQSPRAYDLKNLQADQLMTRLNAGTVPLEYTRNKFDATPVESALAVSIPQLWVPPFNGVNVLRYMSTAQLADFLAVNYGNAAPTVDQSSAVQAAINVCAQLVQNNTNVGALTVNWATLIIPGKLYLASTVYINRLVQTANADFIVQGVGPQAGFYVAGATTMFDTYISAPTDPGTEFVTFKDIRFESSAAANNAFCFSGKFLRMKFLHCTFYRIRCVTASYYIQSWKFEACLVKASPQPGNFIYAPGSYDIGVIDCEISNYGATSGTFIKVDNADASSRGCNGLRIIGCEIEGLAGGTAALTGVSGLEISNCHVEANATVDVNLWAGNLTNNSVLLTGNYVFCANGPWIAHGPALNVTSIGNTVTSGGSPTSLAGQLHNTSIQVQNLISIGDYADGGVSDQPFTYSYGALKIKGPTAGASPTTAARVIERRVTLAYSASIAVDASAGNSFDVTATNGTAFTIQAPTLGVDGQKIRFNIANNSGGALGVLTFAAGYKLGAAWVQPATGNNRSIEFQFNGTSWYERSRSPADVTN